VDTIRIPTLSSGDQKLVKFLAKNNHWTPFGHAFLSFRVKTHIVNARQLVKSSVGLCWNEVSRRYVDDEPTFFMPETWRTRPANVKQGSSETETVTELVGKTFPKDFVLGFKLEHRIEDYVKRHYANSLALYEDMLESGVAPEQARGVLPLFMNTEWIWSGSLAAFARVYKLRIDPHAQKEVRDIAEKIGELIPHNMQHSWAALTEN
jgi:thymidylate synthase (FAD)